MVDTSTKAHCIHKRFVSELGDLKVRDIIEPLSQLQHLDSNTAHEIWVALFPLFWAATPKDERTDLERGMVSLLTKIIIHVKLTRDECCSIASGWYSPSLAGM